MQLLLVGGLLLFVLTKAYFAVLTNRRLIFTRTKMSFWTGGPQLMNLGVEEYDARGIKNVTVSGFANNRSMTFQMADGSKQTLRISPWGKQIAGTKAFLENVPQLITSGELARLGGAMAPPQMGMGGPAPVAQAQGYAQPQYAPPGMAQGYGPPPAFGQAFPPGSRVLVSAPDGHRYPATLVQAQNGQYLCTMPNGQNHWFPAGSVAMS
jgi:hypothetical protein